jgi:hypothetical protein
MVVIDRVGRSSQFADDHDDGKPAFYRLVWHSDMNHY